MYSTFAPLHSTERGGTCRLPYPGPTGGGPTIRTLPEGAGKGSTTSETGKVTRVPVWSGDSDLSRQRRRVFPDPPSWEPLRDETLTTTRVSGRRGVRREDFWSVAKEGSPPDLLGDRGPARTPGRLRESGLVKGLVLTLAGPCFRLGPVHASSGLLGHETLRRLWVRCAPV